MKTRIRAIHGTKDHISALVYVGPNKVGRTESCGNLLFSAETWGEFRSLLTSRIPGNLSAPLLTFLEVYIEENYSPEDQECQQCHMIEEEHLDECPVLEAQTLVYRLLTLVKGIDDMLVLEEDMPPRRKLAP